VQKGLTEIMPKNLADPHAFLTDPDESARALPAPSSTSDAFFDDDPAVKHTLRIPGTTVGPYGPNAPARTEAQRLLRELPGTLDAIGKPLGATKQSVSLWRAGRIPDERFRRKIADVFGIPFDAWAIPPTVGAEPDPAYGEGLDDDDEGADELPAPDAVTAAGSAVRDYDRLIKGLRKQLEQGRVTPRERGQLTDAYSRALAQKARILREHAMLEDRTIRDHPKWQRLKGAIIAALLPHPAAARDVEAAITRLLGEDESESE
jgi:transcriptional regulator with XRE-family HTH domain